jgi:aminomethyltransferase
MQVVARRPKRPALPVLLPTPEYFSRVLKPTPFHSRTAPLVRAAAWRRWGGYQVASSYEPTHDREYAAIRNSAALIDVSPLCKYEIAGRDAERLLDRTITRDVTKLSIGRVMYTTWCDERGKVIDDGTVARLDEQRFRVTSADPSLRWLQLNGAGMDVVVTETSESTAALALQGPLSRDVLAAAGAGEARTLQYFNIARARIGDVPVEISRTGYTGDLGYEIWANAQHAVQVWDLLIAAGESYGITPAGIWALDIARIEAGLLMLGVDYHSAHSALIEQQYSSPFELGLGWSVSASKGPYNGSRALRAERTRVPQWLFVGLVVDWESLESLYARHDLPPALPTIAWRGSAPVYVDGKQAGYASSGCWSPLLKKYIALAHLRAPHHAGGTRVGMEITVEHERQVAAATVAALPFLDLRRRKE